MADPTGEPIQVAEPTILSRITDKVHGHHSSSSDSDVDEKPSRVAAVKSNIYRLFGREKPVHKVLGGGEYADLLLWRDKKTSSSLVGGATLIWIMFEMFHYNFITLVCHSIIMGLAFLFLWSNASCFINKSPPQIPEIQIPDEFILEFVSAMRDEINRGLAAVRNIAIGRDVTKFLKVTAVLWLISFVGSWFSFLTLIYLIFISMHTLPALYERYEDHVDPMAEKAVKKIRKHYAVLDRKVISKFPKKTEGKGKKRH